MSPFLLRGKPDGPDPDRVPVFDRQTEILRRALPQRSRRDATAPSRLPPVPLPVLAAGPAAGAAHAFVQLFAGAADAAFAGGLLFGVLDPADELVAGQGGDVLPGLFGFGVGGQLGLKVRGELVDRAAGKGFGAR